MFIGSKSIVVQVFFKLAKYLSFIQGKCDVDEWILSGLFFEVIKCVVLSIFDYPFMVSSPSCVDAFFSGYICQEDFIDLDFEELIQYAVPVM